MILKLSLFQSKPLTEEDQKVADLIKRRRLQILVHSCIYYRMGLNIISDHTFDRWGNELVKLQKNYPKISEKVELADQFRNFDGSSGFDLDYNHPKIVSLAEYLYRLKKEN